MLVLTPPLGGRGFSLEYRHFVFHGKTRRLTYPVVEKFRKDIFIRFNATHERDRHTDTA